MVEEGGLTLEIEYNKDDIESSTYTFLRDDGVETAFEGTFRGTVLEFVQHVRGAIVAESKLESFDCLAFALCKKID